jgi:hypothetical protein
MNVFAFGQWSGRLGQYTMVTTQTNHSASRYCFLRLGLWPWLDGLRRLKLGVVASFAKSS